MIDATVTISKSMFQEMSITHTPLGDSACFLSTIINNLLFKQTGFFSLESHFPKFPSVLHVHHMFNKGHAPCFSHRVRVQGVFPAACAQHRVMRCWCGHSLQGELFLPLYLSC